MPLTCFKSYDIRGQLGEELNEAIAYRIGVAYVQFLQAKKIVVGCDIRPSSEPLKKALTQGMLDAGADVIDLGLTGTEEIYFAAFHLDVDGGIEVTASHNPIEYNGMKLVRKHAIPISNDSGLNTIRELAQRPDFQLAHKKGTLQHTSIVDAYVTHLLSYIPLDQLKPLTLVVNAGNGVAGPVIDALEARFHAQHIPVRFIKIHHAPDSTFPHGIPNPMLPENRKATASAVIAHGADLGIAWDGDFDRCFLFDNQGRFIEGYYLVGLLAEAFLKKNPGEKIIHDPRLTWNTQDIVQRMGGHAIQCKTGHAFIKERMRAENAIYGGEMSGHHYFRDFAYCDSGMIPWLLVLELLSTSGQPLSTLVGQRMHLYPCSGELNYRVPEIAPVLERVLNHYLRADEESPTVDKTDGISQEFAQWRMNIRASNTEPLLRLNIETRGSQAVLDAKVLEVEALILTD